MAARTHREASPPTGTDPQPRSRLAHGILVATGPGNNGGDGWVVAHALHAAGVRVRVVECAPALTADARAEREQARAAGVEASTRLDDLLAGGESIVVDALLGTGLSAHGSLRGDIAVAVEKLQRLGDRGAAVVALDVPTGLVASSGRNAAGLRAALTITFGTIKRGHLAAREACGTIVVVDIGLGAHAHDAVERMRLASASWFAAMLPRIAADAHKGTRKKIAIVGGAKARRAAQRGRTRALRRRARVDAGDPGSRAGSARVDVADRRRRTCRADGIRRCDTDRPGTRRR